MRLLRLDTQRGSAGDVGEADWLRLGANKATTDNSDGSIDAAHVADL